MLTGTFSAKGGGSELQVKPGRGFSYGLDVASEEAFIGVIALQRSGDGCAWHTLRTWPSTVAAPVTSVSGHVVNERRSEEYFRFCCLEIDDESDGIGYGLSPDPHVLPADAAGVINVLDVELLHTRAVSVDASVEVYHAQITTGGTAGDEELALADGDVVGRRKLLTLAVRTNAADVVVVDVTNVVSSDGAALSALEVDAVGEFVLLEWNGTAWQVVYANATVTPVG